MKVVRAAGLMRSANVNLRRLSEELGHSEPTAFFCECRNPVCFSIVWMSVTDFDTMVENQAGWLLVEGHEPSAAWCPTEPSPNPLDPAPAQAFAVPRSIGGWSSAVRQRLARSA
ncbi:MAG TPA: hypothetical protein VMV08_08515 [Gaiellaceae bacterium]|nr:hypothetical protein [Gaiellaceae bacterium]